MHPMYVIPSRHHLSTKLTPDAVAPKTAQLQKVLAVPHHVSVTIDIWTDQTYSGYKANAFLLSLEAFKGSHTGGSELLKSMRKLYWPTVLLVKSTFV